MSRYTWILDPGHGGVGPGGEYLTPGKRSPEVPPGIYEGEFNRQICSLVESLCLDYDTTTTNPGPVNCGLKERTDYINGLQKVRGNCILLSIHANASGRGGWSTVYGSTVFYHPKNKKGKPLAEWVLEAIDQHTPMNITRGVKPSRFTILSKTRSMPGVLVECGFMTNKSEARFLASSDGQSQIANAIFETIKTVELLKLFS